MHAKGNTYEEVNPKMERNFLKMIEIFWKKKPRINTEKNILMQRNYRK